MTSTDPMSPSNKENKGSDASVTPTTSTISNSGSTSKPKQPSTKGSVKSKSASKTASPVRKRLSLACTTCRQRKVKCDGGKPSCKTCAKFNWPCIYQPSNRKRGPRPRALALMESSPAGMYTAQPAWSASPAHPYSAFPANGPANTPADYRALPSAPAHQVRYVPYTPHGAPTIDRPALPVDQMSPAALSNEVKLYRADNFRSYGDFLSCLSSPNSARHNQQSHMTSSTSQSRRSPIAQSMYKQSESYSKSLSEQVDTPTTMKPTAERTQLPMPSPPFAQFAKSKSADKFSDNIDVDHSADGYSKTMVSERTSAARPQLPPLDSSASVAFQNKSSSSSPVSTVSSFHAEVEKMFSPSSADSLSFRANSKNDALTLPPMAFLSQPLVSGFSHHQRSAAPSASCVPSLSSDDKETSCPVS